MQVASTSAAVFRPVCPRALQFQRCAAASTSSRSRLRSKSRSSKQAVAPAPNALTFTEAVRTLRALSPGDTTSAYELTLLSKLAVSVNVNALRGRSFLQFDPSNTKKKDVILVFAEGEKAEAARRLGADIVGGQELVDELLNSRISPTKIIATPEMLSVITRSQLPRVLGPKGLMPSAKRGSVTEDIAQALKEAKGGLDWKGVEYGSASTGKAKRSDASRGMVSVPIARFSFAEDRIKANVRQFAQEVLDVCNGVGTQAEVKQTGPAGRKKMAQIEKVYLTTTKGACFEVNDAQQLLSL